MRLEPKSNAQASRNSIRQPVKVVLTVLPRHRYEGYRSGAVQNLSDLGKQSGADISARGHIEREITPRSASLVA